MFKNKKIIAIIPARGGSKGIKNKNIVKIAGIPMIGYTITAAKKSKYIDKIFVSTDSKKIKNTAEKFGINVPFLRSPETALDTSKTIDAIIEVLERLSSLKEVYDYLIILQPTSPLRTTEDIDNAIETLLESSYDSLTSVSLVDENPILFRTIDNDKVLNKLINERSDIRRQDFKNYYKVNGAIYINKCDTLKKDTSFNDNKLGYVMDKLNSIDIDTYEDLKKVRKIMKK